MANDRDRDFGGPAGGGWREREGSGGQQGWQGSSFGPSGSYGQGYGGWSPRGPYGQGGTPLGRGPHAGKGPKGYKRSDERVREDACDLLERHPDIDASDIELTVEDGVVTLTGTVDERHTKRLVEDVIENLPGVKDVSNQLRISHGRLDEALEDFSARGTGSGRGTTGAGGPVGRARSERNRSR